MPLQTDQGRKGDISSPWLAFFREVRRLAAKLDALEAEEK